MRLIPDWLYAWTMRQSLIYGPDWFVRLSLRLFLAALLIAFLLWWVMVGLRKLGFIA